MKIFSKPEGNLGKKIAAVSRSVSGGEKICLKIFKIDRLAAIEEIAVGVRNFADDAAGHFRR